MTTEAALADNPFIAILFRILHVVPLRRVSDEAQRPNGLPVDRSRNAGAFKEILNLLGRNGAVLIFPEGKSHNEIGLEPLKTGLARLALQARDESAIKGLKILPLGLVFEDKGTPSTVVGAHAGDVIDMDSRCNSPPLGPGRLDSHLFAEARFADVPQASTSIPAAKLESELPR